MFKEFGLSTDMVDRRIKDEFWRDVSSAIYDVLPVDEEGAEGLTGSVSSRPLGTMVLGKTTFNRQICRRTPQNIVRSALDLYLVQLIIAGDYRGDFDGVNVSVRPGDIFILDLAKVLNSQKDAGSRISLVLPRPILEKWLPARHLHGMVFDRRRATTRLMADYIIGIERVIGDLKPDEIPAVQESLSILLASAIEGAREGNDLLSVTQPLRQRILDYIDGRLNDPQLGPEMIIRRFRVSRSHLYRAFELDGGVARVIREKRLDRAHHLLISPASRNTTMKEIARICGISEGSELSKSFKTRFGLSPSEARSIALTSSSWSGNPLILHDYLLEEAARHGL
jgi:AraC-like DNA-binding protein